MSDKLEFLRTYTVEQFEREYGILDHFDDTVIQGWSFFKFGPNKGDRVFISKKGIPAKPYISRVIGTDPATGQPGYQFWLMCAHNENPDNRFKITKGYFHQSAEEEDL